MLCHLFCVMTSNLSLIVFLDSKKKGWKWHNKQWSHLKNVKDYFWVVINIIKDQHRIFYYEEGIFLLNLQLFQNVFNIIFINFFTYFWSLTTKEIKDKNKKTKNMDGKKIKRKKKGMFIGK
jgi:hypothetical protein